MPRSIFVTLYAVLAAIGSGCGGGMDKPKGMTQCSDGIDNDGDGLIDFPDDPGCVSAEDDSEDSLPMPQCSDGRDNDGDGKIDFPSDPGCFAPQQDSETDDCPNGPGCPQCSNGKDDDGNGLTDYPNDPGCTSASDNDEFTRNPVACGQAVMIKQMPATNEDTGTIVVGSPSNLSSTMCGGMGGEIAYELRLTEPKVVVATTDNPGTTADTVLYIRTKDCTNAAMEVKCSDDISATNTSSTITAALQPGTYYLIVDAHDTGTSGAYDLKVTYFVGEGVGCTTSDTCGPGLVCRVPLNGTTKVCSKHVCSDGVDDDGDGKLDYPDDPGCATPEDDDETDDCPNGPNCPECADGKDNDMDGKTDYPMDLQCKAASSTSEACMSHEAVTEITMGATMADNSMGAVNDFTLSCGFGGAVPDQTFRLDLPKMASLSISVASTTVFPEMELLNSTCSGTAIICSSSIDETNFAAGTYYLVVQSDFADQIGAYTINLSGTIAGGESCESPLATSNAITCASGFACAGTAGARICKPAKCNDGIDNDGDGKIDYPNDPGCTSPSDDDEMDSCPGPGCPVCSDGMDNDTDGKTDFPADFGCASAAGTTEVFCMPETDPATLITMATTTGTTAGKANDLMPGCTSSSSAPDVTYALALPVPVVSLVINSAGTAASSPLDTVLSVRDVSCGMELACNDEGPNNSGIGPSQITLSNVAAGNYAVTVDGYLSGSGAFTLTTKGTVASGTSCTSPLFATGVLVCPTGTTCKGTPKTCAP